MGKIYNWSKLHCQFSREEGRTIFTVYRMANMYPEGRFVLDMSRTPTVACMHNIELNVTYTYLPGRSDINILDHKELSASMKESDERYNMRIKRFEEWAKIEGWNKSRKSHFPSWF